MRVFYGNLNWWNEDDAQGREHFRITFFKTKRTACAKATHNPVTSELL